MANSDKNIVITPNTGSASTPTIVFTGGSNTPGTLTVNDAGTLSFDKQIISSVATGTAPFAVTSTTRVTNLNADYVDDLQIHTSRNNEANKIVRTDVNGYIQAGWINTTSGDNGTTAIDRVYASNDGYIRYYTPSNFRSVLNVPTRTGGDASGTWGISITGNAATITSQANSATITASTTATANQIVLRDGNGDDTRRYGFAQYFNMSHGVSGATTDTIFYSSYDDYIRKNNATGFRASLNVPTRTGGDASGTWSINITGNAATVTNGVYTTGNQSIAGTTNLNVLSIGGKIVAGPLGGNGSTNAGANAISGLYKSRGRKLYLDEEFRSGSNGINVYNNFGGSAVTITRKSSAFADGHTQPPNSSGVVLELRHAPLESLGTTPGYGGWYFATTTGAGKTFVCTFKMKVQAGRTINWASNSIGAGGNSGWLTNNVGTGNYEDYAYYVTSGTSGWSSTFFFYIDGGSNAVFYTYLASATVFEVTSLSGEGFYSLGVGTDSSGTIGEIRATNDVTAYYSDARLKTFLGKIDNPLEKISKLNGYYFYENELAKSLGYSNDARQIGLSAQEVQEILPEIVVPAPIDSTYLTVKYEKIAPLFVEAIKEQQTQITELKNQINALQNKLNTLIDK